MNCYLVVSIFLLDSYSACEQAVLADKKIIIRNKKIDIFGKYFIEN